jgi:trehalose utilization protein
MNDYGYSMNYSYMSGTSMACPHVSGAAALVWSRYSNKTRDWVRLWLRYTADDLGDPGFDVYYGYGRINARKAVEQTPPAHELIAYEWITPPYVEPGTSGTINATILNFGENENHVMVQLLANGTIADSAIIDFLAAGNSTAVSFTWTPTVEGLYNVTLYVVPVTGETSLENNVLWEYIYVGFPVKAVVLHSAGSIYSEIITNWQVLNSQWYLFGGTMICIDYTALNKDNITYQDIAATEADVLIISCASDPYSGWEFTDSEIDAIARYVREGHGLIVTAGTLYSMVPNNNKLAALLGLNEAIRWSATYTDLLHLLNTTHPIFKDVPNPLVFPQVETVLPSDGRWDSNELVGGKYLALGHYQESAITAFRGLVYISPWLEVIPSYYHHHLQLLYNAITWSHYQKPEHELVVSLKAPTRAKPGESTLLNATVSNLGRNNETDVELQLLINGALVNSVNIPELSVDSSRTLSYLWTPTAQGMCNVTAYAPPKSGEELIQNNIATKMVMVLLIAVRSVLVYSDDWYVALSSRYVIVALNNLGINYTYYADDPWGFGAALVSQPWDLVIVDHCNYYAMGQYWTELEEYVRKGGFLVLSTFDIDGSNSEPTTLWGTLGVRWVSDMGTPEPVYRWLPSHAIFTFPNTVGDLTFYIQGYYDSGDHVAATTGTPIAGFTTSPTEGYAAVVVGNTYPTVLFSFRPDEFRYDQDGDGKLDAIELWENAIVYLARGYEHDIAVSLDAPAFLEPGDSVLLNATVRNRGLNNETDVELQLLINGTIVDSVVIPELLIGESYTLSYLWLPTVEGTYNVTAYAPPLLDEEVTTNNIAMKMVFVRTMIKVAVLGDYNSQLTNLLLENYILAYERDWDVIQNIYEYDVVIVNRPNDPGPSTFLALLEAADEHRVGLVFTSSWPGSGAPYGISLLQWYLNDPEGQGHTYGQGSVYYQVLQEHPIFEGWNIGDTIYIITTGDRDHAWFWGYSGETIANIGADYTGIRGGGIAYKIQESGNKHLLLAGLAPQSYANTAHWTKEAKLIFVRGVLWASKPVIYEHDIAVTLEAPALLEPGASVLLNATVRNRGLNNETHVELKLLINGTIVDSVVLLELPVGESYEISHLWTPTVEGTYNVTAYAPPVPDEATTTNNVATKIVSVRPIKHVLFDQTHGTDSIGSYSTWVTSLTNRGYVVETNIIEPITPIVLEGYDVFVIPQAHYSYTADELSAIQNFVFNGGGFLVIGDDNPWIYTELTSFAGIIWTSGGTSGTTTDITPHPVTTGVTTVYLDAPMAIMYVTGVAQDLVRDPAHNIILAVSEQPSGKIIGFADEGSLWDYAIGQADNLLLANNMIDWLAIRGDVAIISVEPSTNEVLAGDTVEIAVVVENQGEKTEDFTVTVYASSLNSTRIYLDPSNYTFDAAAVSIGYRFNVTVKVEDVVGLGAWQVCMYYNDGIINVTRFFEPTWDPEYVFYGKATASPEYLYVHLSPGYGYVMGGAGLYGQPISFVASGKLCIIEFEITAVPPIGCKLSCTLDINNPHTFLLDDDVIPAAKQNGHYELIWGGAPPPPPPGIYRIGTITVTNLAPGANITLTFTWNTTGVPPKDYRIWAEASVVPGEKDKDDNTYIDGIIKIMKPPIASFTHSPPFPKPGETVIFNASASTPDGGTIVSYHWDFGDGNTTTTTDPIITHIYTFSGLFNVTLTITDSDGFTDSTWQMIYVFTRDVAIIDVTPSTNQTYVGRTITINVTVINEGEVAETFHVILYYNMTAGDIIGVQEVSNLPPGGNLTLTFTWNTTGVNPRKYTITGVATPLMGETDVSDNTLSTLIHIRMLGDINGDGAIDMKDVRGVAKCFAAYPDHIRWNPDADLNGDGHVDMKDIRLVAKNFGLSCSP